MKQPVSWALGLAGALAAGWASEQTRITIAVKADGSCQTVTDRVQPRSTVEAMMRSRERYARAEEEGEPPRPEASRAAPAPYSDEELLKKLKDPDHAGPWNSFGDEEDDPDAKPAFEVTKETVRTVRTRAFPSIQEMLTAGGDLWDRAGVRWQDIRFERDTNAHLQVTLSPPRQRGYASALAAYWRQPGFAAEFKLVLPGKVLSSGLPGVQDNATWLAIDSRTNETVEAALKLLANPVTVVTETGGLAIDRPLVSSELRRARSRSSRSAEDLPIADAGPGFLAEAVSLTTVTRHRFPEADKYEPEDPDAPGERGGTRVQVNLFAPKGRTLLAASGVRALHAKDDQGRAIAPAEAGANDEIQQELASLGRGKPAESVLVTLGLQLPAPTAQAIAEVQAEAEATTAGGWKELTVTNVSSQVGKEIPLETILPGAVLKIVKVNAQRSITMVRLEAKGPPAIRRLTVQRPSAADEAPGSHAQERGFTRQGDACIRRLWLTAYDFQGRGAASAAQLDLLVRCPTDLRRERVRFTLQSLDLL